MGADHAVGENAEGYFNLVQYHFKQQIDTESIKLLALSGPYAVFPPAFTGGELDGARTVFCWCR